MVYPLGQWFPNNLRIPRILQGPLTGVREIPGREILKPLIFLTPFTQHGAAISGFFCALNMF